MKNKFLVGVITFLVTIFIMILILNLFDSESKKTFSFDRKINEGKRILSFDKTYKKTNENEHIMFVNSDNYIVERDRKSIDDKSEHNMFYFEDFNFENKKRLSAILPIGANVLFCDLNKVIFTKNFNLFQYNFKAKLVKEIKLKDIKVVLVKPILDSETKFLCLAEYHFKNKYETGFYIIDFENKNIKQSKGLETNSIDSFLENSLRYIGKFKSFLGKNIIVYYCEKYSKIYFFDNAGLFIKELETSDKVPLPKIAKNNEGNSFYSRDGTWYSNLGVFMKDDSVFVFSGAVEDKYNFTIDEYSWGTLQYVESYNLSYNNMNSNSIYNFNLDNNRLIICFDYNYASFKIL
jgi:hypothetical protein